MQTDTVTFPDETDDSFHELIKDPYKSNWENVNEKWVQTLPLKCQNCVKLINKMLQMKRKMLFYKARMRYDDVEKSNIFHDAHYSDVIDEDSAKHVDSDFEEQQSQDSYTDGETEDEISGNQTSSEEDSDTDDSDGKWYL
ncbi:uncharacterized protein LOC124457096 [Xenia sp. Carnegie-2017]|uniref:uncharacterized protein LOC124457096 n=1 Tax=Xenia sp. Carnegie-2017 TaxID=2897299 RepID=UPI001F039016|nr:uncharacterized protein LOC124457096 [Xenia sp. Carnegie-2017]